MRLEKSPGHGVRSLYTDRTLPGEDPEKLLKLAYIHVVSSTLYMIEIVDRLGEKHGSGAIAKLH